MAHEQSVTARSAAELGRHLRCSRRQLGLTLTQLATRTGLSVRFLSELERGKEGASIGRVLQVAATLGVSLPLEMGGEARIDLERYPALRLIAWQRRRQRYLDESEALALYEANWRFVDPADLLPREAELIRDLARRHGHGVLNV